MSPAEIHDLHVKQRVFRLREQYEFFPAQRVGTDPVIFQPPCGQHEIQLIRVDIEHIELIAVRQHIGIKKMKIIWIVVFIDQHLAARDICDINYYIRIRLSEFLQTFAKEAV